MSRVKTGTTRRRRHNELRDQAKGFMGFRRRTIKGAKEGLMHALLNAHVGRRLKKRSMRRLWVTRVNAALTDVNMNYSEFIGKLKGQHIELNRKVLSELAQHDEKVFQKIVKSVQ